MKTIVQINNNNYGSTGTIMKSIANTLSNNGYLVYSCCKNSKTGKKYVLNNQIFIGIWVERVISNFFSYITGYHNSFNYFGTKKFINKLNSIKPSLIHIHNIHGNFINIKMLINYINKNNIPVIWTMHDAWLITGQCSNFEYVNCSKWKTECHNCPKTKYYPASLIDNSKYLWNKKKKLINSINDLTIVTPSTWLYNLVKLSFIKSNNVQIINNGINLNIFKPTNNIFRTNNNLNDKFIILGVANYWNTSKGLDTFIYLAKHLPNTFQIVLVGTNKQIDDVLPDNVISIYRTDSINELIDMYSSSDLFVNPTLEDNFPTVNIESLACGTPVLTYDTGGSKEIIDKNSGKFITKNNKELLLKEIINISKNNYLKEKCIQRAKNFDNAIANKKYLELYKKILN